MTWRPDDPDWLSPLMQLAVDKRVGVVGAKLLYEDGTTQHAGIPVALIDQGVHSGPNPARPAFPFLGGARVGREWVKSAALLRLIVVSVQFQPHRVEDSERAGQTQSKYPGKIPHLRLPVRQ